MVMAKFRAIGLAVTLYSSSSSLSAACPGGWVAGRVRAS